jgi:hypothetical protein
MTRLLGRIFFEDCKLWWQEKRDSSHRKRAMGKRFSLARNGNFEKGSEKTWLLVMGFDAGDWLDHGVEHAWVREFCLLAGGLSGNWQQAGGERLVPLHG